MSYILDALKKAERERGLAQVPTLSTIHDIQKKPRVRIWAVSGIIIVCMAALWFFLSRWGFDGGKRALQLEATPGHAATQPEQGANVEPASVDASASSAIFSDSVSAPRPAASEQSRMKEARKSALASAVPREKDTPEDQNADERGSSAPGRLLIPANKTAAVSLHGDDTPETPSTEPTVLQPIPQSVIPDISKNAKPEADATQQKAMSLKEAASKMNMSIHLYSENKANRLVFIDGRRYAEGDSVEGKYLLESITPEGAVLSSQGERIVLRPGPK